MKGIEPPRPQAFAGSLNSLTDKSPRWCAVFVIQWLNVHDVYYGVVRNLERI